MFEAEALVTADSRWFESTTDTQQQDTTSDPDSNHSANAGNTTYLELLPDTLVVTGDTVTADNQWTEPGFGPILQYEIDVPEAGTYAIAVHGYATGEYDRKIHASVDGLSPGIHQLMFSAADDGFEFDQFVLSPIAIEASSTTQAELAKAVTVGDGVAFGAALAHGFLVFAGLILLLRRRTAQQ